MPLLPLRGSSVNGMYVGQSGEVGEKPVAVGSPEPMIMLQLRKTQSTFCCSNEELRASFP
jgi:hypothetical protein